MANLTIVFMAVLIGEALADDNANDQKDVKMIFCGHCKDDSMRTTLKEFYQCLTDIFPTELDKAKKIREDNKDDLEKCWTEMYKELEQLHKDKPDEFKKVGDCFHKHIPDQTKLATCH